MRINGGSGVHKCSENVATDYVGRTETVIVTESSQIKKQMTIYGLRPEKWHVHLVLECLVFIYDTETTLGQFLVVVGRRLENVCNIINAIWQLQPNRH